MLQSLRRFGSWAGQFPSMAFGLAYLLAIPAFAIFYAAIPFDFYNSTARYEPMVEEQKQYYAERLRKFYLAGHPSFGGQPVTKSTDEVFPLFWVETDPDDVRVLVSIFRQSSGRSEGEPMFRASLLLARYLTVFPSGRGMDDPGSVMVQATILSRHDVDLPSLFPCTYLARRDVSCLTMTLHDYSALMSLAETERGRPTALQNSYWRMLYFSAVTMSTLGYGDIVPVTSRARGIVTVQVMLGPVLFGLFLNALASERRGRSSIQGGGSNADAEHD